MAEPVFDFLLQDAATQRRLAEDALNRAGQIQITLDSSNPSTPETQALEDARQTFMKIAKELAINANNVVTTGTSTITNVLVPAFERMRR